MESLKQFFDQQTPVPPEAWELIRSKFTEWDYEANENIVKEGQIVNYQIFIAQGITRTFYLKDGKEITVEFSFENSFASAYPSFFTGNVSRCYMAALEPVKAYKISKESLYELYDNHKLGERLGRIIVEKKFLIKEDREATLLLDSPKERFMWLQEYHKDWIQRIPQQYLASYIGISPETYSRYKASALHQ
ncbi:MAG: Crp/Fnr family transcriptional regulator [Flavobacteriales bacterium]|nr:Crp/Fnr family transcriptional regulator [Flavobacteriales bacterium]